MSLPPSFPEIYLDAIDRQARLLFSRKDLSKDAAEEMATDLRVELSKLDATIASITGQMDARKGDPEWRASAKRALHGYRRQRDSILHLLQLARSTLSAITRQMKGAEETERARIREANAEACERMAIQAREAKIQRIAAANEETNRFNVRFRAVVRRELGQEVFDRLMRMAQDESSEKAS